MFCEDSKPRKKLKEFTKHKLEPIKVSTVPSNKMKLNNNFMIEIV